MLGDTPWAVVFDERFLDTLDNIGQSSGELKANVKKTIEAIIDNPLKGDPKTGRLKGYRTTHIEHLVIVWELNPTIITSDNLDTLEEVYFHDITHHDNMKSAINTKSPVAPTQTFTISFSSHDVQPTISELYNCNAVTLTQDPDWGNTGVTVTGEVDDDGISQLTSILPTSAKLDISTSQLP